MMSGSLGYGPSSLAAGTFTCGRGRPRPMNLERNSSLPTVCPRCKRENLHLEKDLDIWDAASKTWRRIEQKRCYARLVPPDGVRPQPCGYVEILRDEPIDRPPPKAEGSVTMSDDSSSGSEKILLDQAITEYNAGRLDLKTTAERTGLMPATVAHLAMKERKRLGIEPLSPKERERIREQMKAESPGKASGTTEPPPESTEAARRETPAPSEALADVQDEEVASEGPQTYRTISWETVDESRVDRLAARLDALDKLLKTRNTADVPIVRPQSEATIPSSMEFLKKFASDFSLQAIHMNQVQIAVEHLDSIPRGEYRRLPPEVRSAIEVLTDWVEGGRKAEVA